MLVNQMNRVIHCGSFQSILYRRIATRKRFYKNCSVVKSNGTYEVALDQRKLKTPRGKLLLLDNETLALAVAAEWDAQKDNIAQSTMHLTGLCSTVLDNPHQLEKEDIVNEFLAYIDSDTILFPTHEDGELYEMQSREWIPVTDWLRKRFDVSITPTRDMSGPKITENDKETLRRYFMSYNIWAVTGFRFIIEALKSVILGLACVERRLTVEQATRLSRLEEEFQSQRWGRVEWAHDLSEADTRARVAAGVLFVQCGASKYISRLKGVTA